MISRRHELERSLYLTLRLKIEVKVNGLRFLKKDSRATILTEVGETEQKKDSKQENERLKTNNYPQKRRANS